MAGQLQAINTVLGVTTDASKGDENGTINAHIRNVAADLDAVIGSYTSNYWLRTGLVDSSGNALSSVPIDLSDDYGWGVENTPTDEMRVVIPSRLVGAAFEGSGTGAGTYVDPQFWTATITGTEATCVQASGRVTLTTKNKASNGYHLSTKRRARYVSGSCNGYRGIVSVSAGETGNVRRWGVGYGASWPTVTDGAWFQLSGTTFSVNVAGGSSSVPAITSFNGNLGSSWSPTSDAVYTYEIYWVNSKVYFVVGGVLLHTHSAGVETWASTMSHYVFMDNQNGASASGTNTIKSRVMSIRRLGQLLTLPNSLFIADTSDHILKYGPGVLHRIIVSGDATGSLAVWDGLTGAAPSVQLGKVTSINNNVGVSVDFGGIPFNNGLFAKAATGGSYTVVYE